MSAVQGIQTEFNDKNRSVMCLCLLVKIKIKIKIKTDVLDAAANQEAPQGE